MRPEEPRPASRLADVRCLPAPPETEGGRCEELRCCCGSLLARRVDAGVELKCRRCKRTFVLPLADG